MNMIGHHACSAPGTEWMRCGAVLPDLFTLYGRKVRSPVLLKHGAPDFAPQGLAEELLGGMTFHHAVDAHFHKAPLFVNTSRDLLAVMQRASDTPGLKRFLPAHVLTELYLDHVLIGMEPTVVDAFYADLAEANHETLARFAEAHPAVERTGFAAFLRRFAANRVADDYRTLDGVFFRMNRILHRFGQRCLEEREQEALTAYFHEHHAATGRALAGFLAGMRPLCTALAEAPASGWRWPLPAEWAEAAPAAAGA